MTTAVAVWACARCKRPVDGPQDVASDIGLTVVCPACRELTANQETLRCARCGCVLSTVGAWWKDGKPLCRPCEVTGSLPAAPRSEAPAPVRAPAAPARKAPIASKFVAHLEPRQAAAKGHPALLAVGVIVLMFLVVVGKLTLAQSDPVAAEAAPLTKESVGTMPAAGESSAPRTAPAPENIVATNVRTERQKDRDGRLTLVSGPDPMSALRELCAADGGLQPVAVGDGSFAGSRAGIVRLTTRDGALATVVIQHDPRLRRWAIGNGFAPIQLSKSTDSTER